MVILSEKLKNLPKKPGVYLFKNQRGEVLYVGKSKNLKNRIRSYFPPHPSLPHKGGGIEGGGRIELMISEIADFTYVIVSSETESLMLENNFIKQYRPKFNVRLRDDKNYQFIKVDYESEIPQVYPVRRTTPVIRGRRRGGRNSDHSDAIRRLGSRPKYFGPYTSSLSVKQTLKLLRRIFYLCGNKKSGSRACFYYHIGRCPGVCVGKVSLVRYRKTFRQVEKFLGNRQSEVVSNLTAEMKAAAHDRRFEAAAKLRDQIQALRRIWEKQKIVFIKPVSEDYLSLFESVGQSFLNLFAVRQGKLIHQEIFELQNPSKTDPAQVVSSFVKQYYAEASDTPKKIIVSFGLPEQDVLEKWLSVKIEIPGRGRRYQLLKLGLLNAENYYQKNQISFERPLAELQKILKLPKMPVRIEAYDVSNIQGFLPVGSMVVVEHGQPKKSDYRKFKISRTVSAEGLPKADDFAMMREMLTRRFAKSVIASEAKQSVSKVEIATAPQVGPRNDKITWPLPDLIVVDGGRGQLNAALEVFKVKSLKLKVIGLAKRLEEIYLPDQKEPLRLPEDSPVLRLLQRLRDEAHRFAITFYRHAHRKELIRTKLSEIPGIGPVTRKKLLSKFGSVSGVRSASVESLAQIIGLSAAKKIKENL